MREGRVLSRGQPVNPLRMNRSCQRHTDGLAFADGAHDLGGAQPSAVSTTIRARHTCFCGLLRSRMIDCKRARSAAVTSMFIPLRIPHNGTDHSHRKL